MKFVISKSFSYLYFQWKRIFSFKLFGQCLFFSKALMRFGSGLMRWQGCVQCLHIRIKPVAFNVRAKKDITYCIMCNYYSFLICFWGLSLSSDLLNVKVYDGVKVPAVFDDFWLRNAALIQAVSLACPPSMSSQYTYGSVRSGDMLKSRLLCDNRRWFSLRQLVNIGPRWPVMSQTMTTATSELAG